MFNFLYQKFYYLMIYQNILIMIKEFCLFTLLFVNNHFFKTFDALHNAKINNYLEIVVFKYCLFKNYHL